MPIFLKVLFTPFAFIFGALWGLIIMSIDAVISLWKYN